MSKEFDDVELEKSFNGKHSDDLPPVIPFRLTEEDLDFSKEENILKFVKPSKWVSVDIKGKPFLRFNWVVTLLASIVLWAFVIAALVNQETTFAQFKMWQSWITQNFTWFYIGTQDAWAVFMVYLFFSRYGRLKLGKDDEEPEFSYLAWFTMLFACGMGVGIYYWGVSEPMNYYRAGYQNRLFKLAFDNDDQRAQQAMFITLFHWGIHGWVVYIIMAILLGFVAYRWSMPMTVRSVFFPLIGNTIYGPVGDFIDALSIACTTFGVCTSLGFGAQSINDGLARLNPSIPQDSVGLQIGLIWVITAVATISVLSGLGGGIKILSQITFAFGVFLILMVLFLDNTWFLLNSFVQSTGHYFQYILQAGFITDTWEQLSYEFTNETGSNLLWGSGPDKLYNPITQVTGQTFADPVEFYNQHPKEWMDWWTIFYWGWWIAWSPFVGMFIAKISRGRTIREVIAGAMFVPIVFTFLWLVIMGSLGIKMQRTMELALDVAPDINTGAIDCEAMGYEGGVPVSDNAVGLAKLGYYAIACRNHGDRIYDVLSPYGPQVTTFLHILTVVGVFFYFVTSSDSGSFIDDTLSAGGMEEAPAIQKVYWCCMEGACATALLSAGGSEAISAIQSVSICSGFPYTVMICFMCTALYWACLHEVGDETFFKSTCFSQGVWDWTENKQHPYAKEWKPLSSIPGRILFWFKSLVTPMLQLYPVIALLEDGNKTATILNMVGLTCTFTLWIVFMIAQAGMVNAYAIGWSFYMFFIFHLAAIRSQVRERYNIYGFIINDFFVCLVMFPWVVSQLRVEILVRERKAQ